MNNQTNVRWMILVLKFAGIYNILWGAWVVILPQHFFELTGMAPLNHLMIWQGMGMVIGVYGLGYWWAANSPLIHWPIVAVGLLGKILGPLGFIFNWLTNKVPIEFAYTLITNDLIWWIPFGLILKASYRQHNDI